MLQYYLLAITKEMIQNENMLPVETSTNAIIIIFKDNVALRNYPLFLMFEQIEIESSQSYVFDAVALSEN